MYPYKKRDLIIFGLFGLLVGMVYNIALSPFITQPPQGIIDSFTPLRAATYLFGFIDPIQYLLSSLDLNLGYAGFALMGLFYTVHPISVTVLLLILTSLFSYLLDRVFFRYFLAKPVFSFTILKFATLAVIYILIFTISFITYPSEKKFSFNKVLSNRGVAVTNGHHHWLVKTNL